MNKDNVRSFADAKEEQRRVRCFMDGIDWQHELGAALDGSQLFPSVEAVKEGRICSQSGECGIVEVEVRLVRWVEPQDLYKNLKDKLP